MSTARAQGTKAETAVVNALQRWWPYAERRALRGKRDRGDVAGTPGICWEVKSYQDLARAIREGLQDAEKEAEPGELAVAVARRRNKPAGQWYCVMTVDAFAELWHERDEKTDAG